MVFNNNFSEPTDLELYFIESQISRERYDFELLRYLMKRNYKQEAAALLKNFIDIEDLFTGSNTRCS